MYKVVVRFADLQDAGYIYEEGEIFPREGKEASEARIAELASVRNNAGKVLIKQAEEDIMPELVEVEEAEPEKVEKSKKQDK